jgi:hypothetical protein
MGAYRPVFSTEDLGHFGPITKREIDIALYYVDQTYTVQMDPDFFEHIFNTVQQRRRDDSDLHDLAQMVVVELVHESEAKQVAILGGVMKIYNHHLQMQRQSGRTRAKHAKKKTHPIDEATGQHLLFPPARGV